MLLAVNISNQAKEGKISLQDLRICAQQLPTGGNISKKMIEAKLLFTVFVNLSIVATTYVNISN